MTQAALTGQHEFCTFKVNGLLYGVDLEQVQEIIRYQDMTAVPLSPGSVSGLINLRGQIVMAIDMRRRLGLPPSSSGGPPTNVVVRCDDETVSLLVDDIGDVIDADGGLERPPATLHGVPRELLQAVYKLDNGLLLVLDVAAATDLTS
jgi:purine-binding chemotaxis protein CheW